jgi:hypothetical protein
MWTKKSERLLREQNDQKLDLLLKRLKTIRCDDGSVYIKDDERGRERTFRDLKTSKQGTIHCILICNIPDRLRSKYPAHHSFVAGPRP